MPGETKTYMQRLLPPLNRVSRSIAAYLENFDTVFQQLVLKDKSSSRLQPGRSDFSTLQEEIMMSTQHSAVFEYLSKRFIYEQGFFAITKNKVTVDQRDQELALLFNAGSVRQHLVLSQKKLNAIIVEKGRSAELTDHKEKPMNAIEALQFLAQDDMHCFIKTDTSAFSLTPDSMSMSKEFKQFEAEIQAVVSKLIKLDNTSREYRYLFAFITSVKDSHLKAMADYIRLARTYLQPPKLTGLRAAKELLLPKNQPAFSAVERLDASLIRVMAEADSVAIGYEKFMKKERVAFNVVHDGRSREALIEQLRRQMHEITTQIKRQGSMSAGRQDVTGYPLYRFLALEKTIAAYEKNCLHNMAKLLKKLKKEFSGLKQVDARERDSMVANIVHAVDQKLVGNSLRYIVIFMIAKAISNCGPETFDFFEGMKSDLELTLEQDSSIEKIIEKLKYYQQCFKSRFGTKLSWYNNSQVYMQILQITMKLFNEMEMFDAVNVREAQRKSIESGMPAENIGSPPTVSLADIHSDHANYLRGAPGGMAGSSADKKMQRLLQTNPQLQLVKSDYPDIAKHADAMLPREYRAKYSLLREKLTRLQAVLAAASQSKIRNFCSSYLTMEDF